MKRGKKAPLDSKILTVEKPETEGEVQTVMFDEEEFTAELHTFHIGKDGNPEPKIATL